MRATTVVATVVLSPTTHVPLRMTVLLNLELSLLFGFSIVMTIARVKSVSHPSLPAMQINNASLYTVDPIGVNSWKE